MDVFSPVRPQAEVDDGRGTGTLGNGTKSNDTVFTGSSLAKETLCLVFLVVFCVLCTKVSQDGENL
jgi:hypothetical protein